MSKKNSTYSISCLLLLLITTEFFSCSFIKIPNVLFNVTWIFILIFIVAYNRIIGFCKLDKIVLGFMLIPFVSSIGAYLYHEQTIIETILASTSALFYLYYFYLRKKKKPVDTLISSIIILSVIYTTIEVVAQVLYPQLIFGFILDGMDGIEVRNGLYRIRILGAVLPVFSLFYSFYKLKKKVSYFYISLFLYSLIGIYMQGTRQIIASALLIIAINFLYGLRKKMDFSIVFLALVLGFLLYSNFDKLFGDMVEQTSEVDENYSRFRSYSYYGYEGNIDNDLAILLGNGQPYGDSKYGRETMRLQPLGIYASDVGIVGLYYYHGLLLISLILFFYYFVFKNRSKLHSFLNMYVVYCFISNILQYYFEKGYFDVTFMSVIMYLCYSYIYEYNKLELNKSK